MDYCKKIEELYSKLNKDNFVLLSTFSSSNKIYAKVENQNLTGSIKDRAVLQMMLEFAKEGKINENTVFIEATSGNTGISISYIAHLLGLKSLIIMPDNMSIERRKLIKKNYGDLLLVSGGMKECEEKLNDIITSDSKYLSLSQFNNYNNLLGHYLTTAKEIDDYKVKFDYIVAGIGTGGTICGIGKYFKEFKTNTKIIGVEPLESPLLTKGYSGSHLIQGIGGNFIPKILDLHYIDEIIDVKSNDAISMKYDIFNRENIDVGISSGAALLGGLEINKKVKGKNILVIFPDNGDRYEPIRKIR